QSTVFRETKVNVVAGSTSRIPLKIVLTIAGVQEQVTVAASDTSAQVSTEISQNQKGNSLARDYSASLSRFLDPDATGTNGVTLVVNGVEANGPGVTPSAVQNVKVNQN